MVMTDVDVEVVVVSIMVVGGSANSDVTDALD